MLVCYVEIKKPRARKFSHVLTFTDENVLNVLNYVAKISFDTLMSNGNAFDFKATICGDNFRKTYILRGDGIEVIIS